MGPENSILVGCLESREKYGFLLLSLMATPADSPRWGGHREDGDFSEDKSTSVTPSTSLRSPALLSSPLPASLLSSPPDLDAPPSLVLPPCFGESGESDSESKLANGEAERLGEDDRLS